MSSTSESSNFFGSQQQDDFVICSFCNGRYKKRGLTRHIRIAHQSTINLTNASNSDTNNSIQNESNPIDELFVKGFGRTMLNSSGIDGNFPWERRWKQASSLNGKQYILPNGVIGRQFVQLITNELLLVINNENIGCEKLFVLCACILQKDVSIKMGADVRRLLKKRMTMWTDEKYDELLEEAIRCDKRIKHGVQKCEDSHKIRIFTRLVMQGKLRDATRWITDRAGGGVLDLNEICSDGKSVLQCLQSKHPNQMIPDSNLFLSPERLPMMTDVDISANHIERVARSLKGGAGPSGTDSEQWKSMLLRYGTHSAQLREAIASFIRLLANGIVDWNKIKSLLCRRGVALDKCPGVRPIGVGEVLQRICAKTMVHVTGEDIQEVCGADQLCAGTKSGIEGAIHSMTQLFENDEEDNALLLMDASNAFNNISRPLALWNARILWPRCARFLFNTYQGYAVIKFRKSSEVILSREGTTQGDPLAMLMYAVGILPLIKELKNTDWIQNWYADDSSCFGKMEKIKKWLILLMEKGPKWGYYPEPSKSVLIVKHGMETEARMLFQQFNIDVVHSHSYLGGMIGSNNAKSNFVQEKVNKWNECVMKFAEVAKKSPQAAFVAFTKSLQFEWSFLQRIVDCSSEKYLSLKNTISSYLTPAILGREISNEEHELFSLPAKLGGLGIKNPVQTAEKAFEISKKAVAVLSRSIVTGENLDVHEHNMYVKKVLHEERHLRKLVEKEKSDEVISSLNNREKRTISRIVEGDASQWLTVVSTSADNYDLSPTQFRDALALRYGKEISLPEKCDGCGNKMDVCHALNCKKGGLVKFGHDNIRDDGAMLAKMVFNNVTSEPILQQADDVNHIPALIADVKIVGLWESGRSAFLDYRIVNADATSYLSQDCATILNNHANEKHRKYNNAAEDIRASFTPMVCTTDCVMHREFKKVLSRIAFLLSEKSQKPFSRVQNWILTQTQFSIIRAVGTRLRGTRKRISHMTEDGAII